MLRIDPLFPLQCDGGPKRAIFAGATATGAMSHFAIQEAIDGPSVEWMEKVTDDDYLAEATPD